MNQAIHNVDLLLWMMGSAAMVSGFTATLAHERIEVEDTAVAVIRFQVRGVGGDSGHHERSSRLSENNRHPRG